VPFRRVSLRFLRRFLVATSALAVVLCVSASAQPPQREKDKLLAPTPPMGWNSWDSYGETVTEAQVRANADWMAKNLKQVGWQYVVIDEGWYVKDPGAKPDEVRFAIDDTGRFIPVADRFPSSVNGAGFKPLADYVHSLGLKFGIHIMRGIPREAVAKNLRIANSPYTAKEAAIEDDTCPWNNFMYGVQPMASGQAYYNSIMALYTGWGVDFIKVDCIADHPYKPEEMRTIGFAILFSGREMILSVSPGPTAVEHAKEVSGYAEMWRISDDFWDHWGPLPDKAWSQGVKAQFGWAAKWESFNTPGRWPDLDMLPFGHFPHPGDGRAPRNSYLTHDEQQTVVNLWCIFQSPLIMGGDLPSSDNWTKQLLTNAEVLAVNQHASGRKQVVSTETAVVWTSRPNDGKGYYVALFNLADKEQTLSYDWTGLKLPKSSYVVRDLWSGKDLGAAIQLKVTLRSHASVLYRVVANP